MQSRRKTIGMNLGFRKSLLLMSKRCAFSQRKHLERRATEKLKTRMEKLKVEMEEIGKEQESIRKGQRGVKEKFERIELECEQLRRETDLITQQSHNTQLRLCLMFQILKAREVNDFTKAAALTQILREVIAKQSKEK
ncbi:uncharacterized protein LOC111294297 isoform X2 [Durio zibethinus]|uniref:Uncharacterized protein LOC111294297 isoform X2 n=1 Tax=Durio zibethinus TaxID=66656 RepID=A0A6P5YRX1_DURZI|nr:uncharacterized protein LOC111294297 isoform X2 [Durio zibethinus]